MAYTPLPTELREIANELGMRSTAYRLALKFAALRDEQVSNGTAPSAPIEISNEQLHTVTGMARTTINAAIKELRAGGWITVKQGPRKAGQIAPANYWLHPKSHG